MKMKNKMYINNNNNIMSKGTLKKKIKIFKYQIKTMQHNKNNIKNLNVS